MPSANTERVNLRTSALFVYVADLELEVDRLRKYCQLLVHDVGTVLDQVRARSRADGQSQSAPALAADIESLTGGLTSRLRDWHESGDLHPAYDEVAPITLRPLIEQVFAWQQRVHDAPYLALRLELQCEVIAWFPGRLRHIVENLISNALKHRRLDRGEARVCVGVTAQDGTYELRISDNGPGMASDATTLPPQDARSSPIRAATLGVGLSVVKVLVEQSGGSLTTHSGDGQGTTHVVVLPRYDLEDSLSSTSAGR